MATNLSVDSSSVHQTGPARLRLYVAGHTGLVGSAIVRALEARGYQDIVRRGHEELDLMNQAETRAFFQQQRPDVVILAAARVGGIMANWEAPYEFIHENLGIELNVIHEAFAAGVKRLIFLGSSCIYPKLAPQPLKEEYLLTGPLEETNRPYALAKIAGIELCRSLNREYDTEYISLMPTNLFGPGDNFDLETSHLVPALIRRFHEAKLRTSLVDKAHEGPTSVQLWGTGAPRRELLHVDDLADAVCMLVESDNWREIPDGLLNVGTGEDMTIADLATLVAQVVGYEGAIEWNPDKPDGTPRKLLDTSRIRDLGWRPHKDLPIAIRETYEWFMNHETLMEGGAG